MFKKIKKIVPISVKKYYWRYQNRKRKAEKKRIMFDNKTPKETFTYIYNTNYWSGHESISGGGSDSWNTKIIIQAINDLIIELELKSILDVPCGDFAWMKNVKLKETKYIGADIVDELIHNNSNIYGLKNKVEFEVIDLLNDRLPKSDIVINRDCLVHLSFKDIYSALKNIKNSGCEYLLTTTYPKHDINTDITTGDWRTLNFEKEPFNFGPPVKLINEQYNKLIYDDKSLALWKIEDIILQQTPYNK